MERLIEGYRQFRRNIWPAERDRYEALAHWGQRPETLVIACSDSRVDPQTVFGAVPGELFVVRNMAGLVPPFQPDARYHGTSAALEYAVRVLRVRRIVVLGHALCGGIRAMVEGAPKNARDFVEPWVAIAEPVLKNIPPGIPSDQVLAHCEAEAVRLSLDNLQSFPWVREGVDGGSLELLGFRFDIHTGVLSSLVDGDFVQIEVSGPLP